MIDFCSKKRFLLLTFLLVPLVITSFLVGGSANDEFVHQFNILPGYFQPYQIGLPSTASGSVTPTIEVKKDSNYSLVVWLLTEQGYSLLKDGLWFGNESVAKYDFAGDLSVSFQWTFAPGDTNYLVLDTCGLPKNSSSVTGTVKITNAEGLSTVSSSIISGFTAIIAIPVLLLITPIILRARKTDQER